MSDCEQSSTENARALTSRLDLLIAAQERTNELLEAVVDLLCDGEVEDVEGGAEFYLDGTPVN